VRGHGFGRGTRAWALGGEDRAYVPLRILSESDVILVIDAADAVVLPDPVDLVLVSDGAQLAVLDARGHPVLDTAEPPDTGVPHDSAGEETNAGAGGGTCGCGGSSQAGAMALLLAILAAAARQRGPVAGTRLALGACGSATAARADA